MPLKDLLLLAVNDYGCARFLAFDPSQCSEANCGGQCVALANECAGHGDTPHTSASYDPCWLPISSGWITMHHAALR